MEGNSKKYTNLNMEGEILSGVMASFIIAPMVTMVDKALFSHVSGKQTFQMSFRECARQITNRPSTFFKSSRFLLVWAVYAATFSASNCADRYARRHEINPAEAVFVATCATNITMSVIKDRFLTVMYGLTAKPIPKATLLCYALRDMITICGSFTLVPPVAEMLSPHLGMELATIISQLYCPVATQLINTPIFLYGADLYNRSQVSWRERWKFIRKNYWSTYYWMRVTRVGPAFSIGGVLNTQFRHLLTHPVATRKKEMSMVDAKR